MNKKNQMTRRQYLGLTAAGVTTAAAGLFGFRFLFNNTSTEAPNKTHGLRNTRYGVISDSEMRRNSAKLGSTFEQDIPYLWRKYREQVCDTSTGLDNETIEKELLVLAEKLQDQPREIAKARLFAFVCDNITIDVSPHDWFVAFGCWDRNKRPLTQVISRWDKEVSAAKMKTVEIANTLQKSGAADLWKDYDHSTPDWETILTLGFPGIRERARNYRRERENRGTLDKQAAAYFDGIEITYTAILDTLDRFHAQALKRAGENNNNPRLLATGDCLQQLRHGPPTNTYETLQFIFLYFMFSEHIDHFQARTFGNLAVLLFPCFQADLAAGRFTEAQIREYFAYFMMQYASINNYWGHPFYFGGVKANGETEINELAYLILDVFDQLGITSPKIQIKFDGKTPEMFVNKVLDMIRRGHNSFTFVCESGIRHAFLNIGLTEEDARTSVITGCYESIPKYGNNTAPAYLNLLKPMELAFNNGIDPVSGIKCGIETGEVETFKTFDDFYAAYTQQAGDIIDRAIAWASDAEQYLSQINPAHVLSGATENSLRTARDAFHNGSVHNNTMILLSGFGSIVDALCAVNELVFVRRETTLAELRNILRGNWDGHGKLRLMALRRAPKYGNGNETADNMAITLGHFLASKINRLPNARGGIYLAAVHAARHFIVFGDRTGATPDGRLAGEEMSKNASPTMGMDTNGVTALIKSVTALDTAQFPGDFPLDIMLHPSTVTGDEGLVVMRALLKTYMDRNGTLIQFNIFDAQTLIDAQKHPEKYEYLQVRVCGWTVRFNDLPKEEQDAYIRRAMNIKS